MTMNILARVLSFLVAGAGLLQTERARSGDEPATRIYQNQLKPIADPRPILADYPQFVEPVREVTRFESPTLIDDPGADLEVRAWRFSYNARGIIEVPNRLRSNRTAVIVVHPWGIDDGQGWRTPEPAGVAFQCTPVKNKFVLDHAAQVINPFLKSMRARGGMLVGYSLPGKEDAIRRKIYRSVRFQPDQMQRQEGEQELRAKLNSFDYRGRAVRTSISLNLETPIVSYFKQFPGLDAGPSFEGQGFWELPVPVMRSIEVDLHDFVIYDGEGYAALRSFLQNQGVKHVLLAGYNTDMCVCSTTAGYKNLAKDFNVFLIGDATIATFPAQPTPRFATTTAVCFAALDLFITQVSWVRPIQSPRKN
jgi:Isochorismatase family